MKGFNQTHVDVVDGLELISPRKRYFRANLKQRRNAGIFTQRANRISNEKFNPTGIVVNTVAAR